MDISSAFPSKFIKATDLQGQDVTVSIARFAMESVDDDTGELKPVIYFAGHQRGLVLNKTNALTISELYSTETDNWLGKPITLFATHCQYGAKMVDCIRVRPFPPQPVDAAQAAPVTAPPAAPSQSTMQAPQTLFEKPLAQQEQPTTGQSPVQF